MPESRDKYGRIRHEDFSYPFVDELSDLTADFRENLESLATEPREKARINPEAMKSIILQLCRDQFMTVGALSTLLNREVGTLRGQYLAPLKQEGKLQLAFPRTPTDPKQAYLASPES